jgi:hypothetical protein
VSLFASYGLFLIYSSVPKMDRVNSSETSVNFYGVTLRYISEFVVAVMCCVESLKTMTALKLWEMF